MTQAKLKPIRQQHLAGAVLEAAIKCHQAIFAVLRDRGLMEDVPEQEANANVVAVFALVAVRLLRANERTLEGEFERAVFAASLNTAIDPDAFINKVGPNFDVGVRRAATAAAEALGIESL